MIDVIIGYAAYIIPAIVFVVLAVVVLLWIMSLRVVVPTNMVHIVQQGKNTIEYGKGRVGGNVYYRWPESFPKIGLSLRVMPESIFSVKLEGYEAYDAKKLKFMVDVVAFFRIEVAAIVAQRVDSMNELHAQIENILQGSIRSILGKHPIERIMEDRTVFADQFTQEVGEQLEEWGVVTTKPIELMDIRDAKGEQNIDNIMSVEKSRIEKESRIARAVNNKEAQNKEIETDREVELQRQQAKQQVGVRQAQVQRETGLAAEQAKQEIAIQSKITTEREMDVKQVAETRQAEIDKQVAAVQAEQDSQVATIRAEADKKVTITAAEAQKASSITAAEGQKESALLEASGIRSIGEARGAAEQALLMAPVNAQIAQAREIGSNEPYQQYLITIRQIEANQAIGIEAAGALKEADLKVIANSGNIQEGMSKLTNMVSSTGGVNMAGMIEGLSQTETGKALVNSFISRLGGKTE